MDQTDISAIKEELGSIRTAIDANTKTVQRSRLWQWIQGLTLATIIGIGLVAWWDDRQDDKRESAQQEQEDKQDCLNGISAREDNRQRLLEIAREIGSQRLTDVINGSYEDSPPPAACD